MQLGRVIAEEVLAIESSRELLGPLVIRELDCNSFGKTSVENEALCVAIWEVADGDAIALLQAVFYQYGA